MTGPLVSIVIPAYRPGRLFEATLRSCLEQDHKALEIVVALDGEDDEVRAAVAAAADPRVRLFADGERRGQFANFNRAVDLSSGELVKLFSADDLMSRDCVSRMVAALAVHPEVGLCASRHVAFSSDESGRIASRLEVPEPGPLAETVLSPLASHLFTALYGNQLGGPSNVMLRRSAWWATGGFDPRIGHLGDLAFWNRLLARSGGVLLDRPLVAYRIHQNSVTGRDALGMIRVEEPFAIAEDATLGACFPERRWWERVARQLLTVNGNAGFALSMLRRSPLQGARALWRVLLACGIVLVPVTAVVTAVALVRSSLLRRGPLWPASEPGRFRGVEAGALDEQRLVELLSDPSGRLLAQLATRQADGTGAA